MRRKAKPGALANGLGRKKRLENSGLRRRIHSDPCIADDDESVVARRDGASVPAEVALECGFCCGDRKCTTRRHGIAGIESQVDHYLLDLRRVGPNPTGAAEGDGELMALTQQPPDHRLDVAHHRIEFHDLRMVESTPTEGQELPGDRCGAFDRLYDLPEIRKPIRRDGRVLD